MLIDATHSEETRVVVLNGSRLEEFDFETSTKKQIKGNIYLAKITRVEPSLQAAFVEYGGNRHGFLAFSEIHPDYYRIPVSDREAMVAAERRAHDEGRDDEDDDSSGGLLQLPEPVEEPGDDEPPIAEQRADMAASSDEPASYVSAEPEDAGSFEDRGFSEQDDGAGVRADRQDESGDEPHEPAVPVETVGGDEFEEVQARPRVRHYRNYKIQEVIKRRQILLIQVTKEERGNKGAALTTYLSLAGRYCVLMPNAGRGGGVSRKITSAADRRRLKELMEDLDVPDGMGVIVRTAGSERSKTEIKRDYEYLLRLWDDIRELTLRSSAPALIYEEGNLIKRAIRDLYTRDIEEILVEGETGYRTAKEFMRMLMPSHASRVRLYRDPAIPLYHRFQVDSQIDQIHNPVVQLRSGGYIVINPTEALVSIDVNSGRATKERNIEETATKTNLEASDEIARQLRLRDLAGLVVIDFIDMEDQRNQRAVEARVKEAMKLDRARIQLGRISAFGLLELSRQRLRSSLIEASTQPCIHCNGTGTVRSTESTTLVVLRALEEEGIRRRTAELTVFVPTQIALYLLNQKRDALIGIEKRYAFRVTVAQDDTLIPPAYRLDRLRALTHAELDALPPALAIPFVEEEEDEEAIADEADAPAPAVAPVPAEVAEAAPGEEDRPRRKRRRRKRRRGGPEREAGAAESETDSETEAEGDGPFEADDVEIPFDATPSDEIAVETGDATEIAAPAPTEEERADPRRRRRGKRGGRRRRFEDQPAGTGDAPEILDESYASPLDFARDDRPMLYAAEAPAVARPEPLEPEPMAESMDAVAVASVPEPEAAVIAHETAPTEAPAAKKRRAPRRKKAGEPTEPVASPPAEETPAPKRSRRRKPAIEQVEAVPPAEMTASDGASADPPEESAAPLEAIGIAEIPVAETAADTVEAEPFLLVPVEAVPEPAAEEAPAAAEEPDDRPRKSGWWRRLTS
jgi:ribonuclease E